MRMLALALEDPWKYFSILAHESLGIFWILRKSLSDRMINDIVHNHECHPVRPLPLGLRFLIVNLPKRKCDVIITLKDGLNRLVHIEGMVSIHNDQNHLNVSLPLNKVHPPKFSTPFM
jgi:hypothetical protein